MAKVNPNVKGVTLEHIVKDYMQNAGYCRDFNSTTSFKNKLKKIDKNITNLERQMFGINPQEQKYEVSCLRKTSSMDITLL